MARSSKRQHTTTGRAPARPPARKPRRDDDGWAFRRKIALMRHGKSQSDVARAVEAMRQARGDQPARRPSRAMVGHCMTGLKRSADIEQVIAQICETTPGRLGWSFRRPTGRPRHAGVRH